MLTRSRLNGVYKNAEIVPFDDESKFVFFSDVHRGDNSLSDDFGRNRHIYYYALDYYYESGFTYVEVGDGDELWENPIYEHITNAHPAIFDQLKNFHNANRLYMMYGNHNMALRDDDYVKRNLTETFNDETEQMEPLFPGLKAYEGIRFVNSSTDQEIFVVHGHQGDLMNDQLWRVSFLIVRYFWRFMHILGVNYAASPAKNKYVRHKIEKAYNKWNVEHPMISLICGHTHRARFPGKGDQPYFNTGCCMHPRGITCIELKEGEIMLVNWHMHTRKDGLLYVKRTVLKGPVPVVQFMRCNDGNNKNYKRRKER